MTGLEQYRPVFHFSPSKNWMNDPNGLVYHKGEYHLFYQYNPFDKHWGNICWGHAVSTNLINWKHLPVAIHEDKENETMVFSGSCVVDKYNVAGLGSNNDTMVAFYTESKKDLSKQSQSIAFSNDIGRTWEKFESNPIIESSHKAFRDPKVFWFQEINQWIMVVALSEIRHLQFYSSVDLIKWKLESEYHNNEVNNGLLECPDMFQLHVENKPDEIKWVLLLSGIGAYKGLNGMHYLIGNFNGKQFKEEQEIKILDYGKDFYAGYTWNNIPKEDGRRILIGWANNWNYSSLLPTHPWRGMLSIPRELFLKEQKEKYIICQKPIVEYLKLREEYFCVENIVIDNEYNTLYDKGFYGTSVELLIDIDLRKAEKFGIKILKDEKEETIIEYSQKTAYLSIDRRKSGNVSFHNDFLSKETARVNLIENKLKLHVFIDKSIIEVFVNDGEVVFTERVFPSQNNKGLIHFYTDLGSVTINKLELWRLKSILK